MYSYNKYNIHINRENTSIELGLGFIYYIVHIHVGYIRFGRVGASGPPCLSISIPCACSRGTVAPAIAQTERSLAAFRWRSYSCPAAAQRIHRIRRWLHRWLRPSVCPSPERRSAEIELIKWGFSLDFFSILSLTWHCTHANRATSTAAMRTSLLGFMMCSMLLVVPAVAFIPKRFEEWHSQPQFN